MKTTDNEIFATSPEGITNRSLGMFRVAACVPRVRPAAIADNCTAILGMARECDGRGVELAVFPELCVTGYTCADLFHDSTLLAEAVHALQILAEESESLGCVLAVGMPLAHGGRLYNCAAVLHRGEILGFVPKSYLPDYNEFYEKRWFASGYRTDARIDSVKLPWEGADGNPEVPFGCNQIFSLNGVKVGVEICEDLWVPEPPSGGLCMAGADVIVNLSASDALIGKRAYALDLMANQSARCRCGYVYASAGFGESSTDLAFAGNAVIAENGSLLAKNDEFDHTPGFRIADIDVQHLRHDRMHFSSFSDHFACAGDYVTWECRDYSCGNPEPLEYRRIDPTPFVDKVESRMNRRCDEISSIQAWGLATRLKAIGCRAAVIGISGGLDSTLALLLCVKAFDMLGLDRKGIHGITMPGFGTTVRTKGNAERLMDLLGITSLEIPIGESVSRHFKDIGHDPEVHDITYENAQARERTQILMDYANKVNGIVVGTGDLSELALGWCTYNADQMSMYGVNASVPKTMVRYLVGGYARKADDPELRRILLDIIDTPISPELLPPDSKGRILQKTEDKVGPYELHDFFLYHMMRFGEDPVKIATLCHKAFDGKYDLATIYKWLRTFYKRFFSQQFKRSCMPDGVKVGSICLSPRGDWRMPSDASASLWLQTIDEQCEAEGIQL